MQIRPVDRGELPLIWTIDRSEVHTHLYRVRDGALVLEPSYFEIPGWHPRGAHFIGAFDGNVLAGISILDRDRLAYLYVGQPYRGKGVGSQLFDAAIAHATTDRIVISATPTENTVDFYLRRGCVLDPSPDPAALAAEPEDVHLVFRP